MTAHEVFTALFWLVAGSYLTYVAWNVYAVIARRFRKRNTDRREMSSRSI